MDRYPDETLDPDYDDGMIVDNANQLREAVVGHKIVDAFQFTPSEEIRSILGDCNGNYRSYYMRNAKTLFAIVLDTGAVVILADTEDCCAYTDLRGFFLDPSSVNHVIMGLGTTGEYNTWHIYADYGDILRLEVGWSCGNPFYYGYGFDIEVIECDKELAELIKKEKK